LIAKEKFETIRTTNLGICLEILGLLRQNISLKLAQLMEKTNVTCSTLRDNLDFLIKQGLIETINIGEKRKYYVITQLGTTVFEQFSDLNTHPTIKGTKIEAKDNEIQFVLGFSSLADVNP